MSESLSLAEPISNRMELQPPSRRGGHRHRRSAAISGDFDVQGMGIFLPPPPSNTNNQISKSVPNSLHGSPIKPSFISKFETTSTPDFILNDEDSKFSSLLTPPTESTSSFKKPAAEFFTPNASSSPLSASPQLRYFMTEDAKFDKDSKVPDAVIDLDDIINKPVLSHSTTPNLNGLAIPIRKPEPPSNFFPRHSLFASPKKNEVSIVEGIREEESENDEADEIFEAEINQLRNKSSHNSEISSLNSVMAGNSNKSLANVINDNCSSNSLTSVNSNGSNNKSLSHFNTASQPSLRSKVRYQSYFNQQLNSPTLAPLNPSSLISTSSSIPDIKPIKKPLLPHPNSPSILKNKSNSRSPVRNLRFQNTVTFSSTTKNPFQYESITYDISKDFHKENDYLGSMSLNESVSSQNTRPEVDVQGLSNPSISISSVSLSGKSTVSATQSPESTSAALVGHQRTKSSASTSSKLFPPLSKSDKHKRSSSLFSTISSKLHHRRRSSIQSNRKSIIEQQTTDEFLGLDSTSCSPTAPTLASDISNPIVVVNDTIIMDDATLSEDIMVGEPGPMINAPTIQNKHKKVLSNISNNLNNNNNNKNNIENHNKKPLQNKENCSGKHSHSNSEKFLEPPRKGHIKRGSTSRLLSWISKPKRSENI